MTPEYKAELPDVKWNCVSTNLDKKVEKPPTARLSVALAKQMQMKGTFFNRALMAGHSDLKS